jgi:hypothetical protein
MLCVYCGQPIPWPPSFADWAGARPIHPECPLPTKPDDDAHR